MSRAHLTLLVSFVVTALTQGVSCTDSKVVPQREEVIPLSATLSVKARGGAVTQVQSAEDGRAHFVSVAPHSPSLIIDLEHTGCELERVSVLLPQRLPFATLKYRAYLGEVSERDQALEEATPGFTWGQDPSAEGWTPLGEPREGDLSLLSEGERLITFELRRSTGQVTQITDMEFGSAQLIKALEERDPISDIKLPTPEPLPLHPPCARLNEVTALNGAPLVLRLSINLFDRHLSHGTTEDSTELTRVGVVSGLRWSEARSADVNTLISQLNDASLDAVILLGDLTEHQQLNELAGLILALRALESPWMSAVGDEDQWVTRPEWYERLGYVSYAFDRGPLRVGVLNTSLGSLNGDERSLIKRWGREAGLLWPQDTTPRLKLLLTHTPLLPSQSRGAVTQRAEAIQLLNLAIESGVRYIMSASSAEPHPALQFISAPDFSESGAWVELLATARCAGVEEATEPCLVTTLRGEASTAP